MTAGSSLVVDSHAFIWYVQASPRLSDKARQAMDDATSADVPLMISAATLVELALRTSESMRLPNASASTAPLDGSSSGCRARTATHSRCSGDCEPDRGSR